MIETIQALANLLVFGVVLGGALPLSYLLLSDRSSTILAPSLARNTLIVLTTWSIIQVCVGLFLGALGQLRTSSVVFAELVLFGIGFVLLRRRLTSSRANSFAEPSQITKSITKLRRSPALSGAELLILTGILVSGLFVFTASITQPTVNFDSLWFQLPVVARWYQSGSLTLLDPTGRWIFEHMDAAIYPYNWHILSLLCVLPFGRDLFVALPMLLAWVMVGLAVYLLSLEFGANRFYSLSATALVLFIPMLVELVNTQHVDTPLAAFYLISFYFAYSSHKTRSASDFALFLAATGMGIGLKTIGAIYGLFVIGFWFVLELVRWMNTRLKKQSFLASCLSYVKETCQQNQSILLLGFFAFLVLGGFWYVCNAMKIGQAIADFSSVQIASTDSSISLQDLKWERLVEKFWVYQRSTLTHQFNPSDPDHWRTLFTPVAIRLQFPFMILLLQLIFLPYAAWRVWKKGNLALFIHTVFFFVASWFLYWNTPYSSGTSGSTPQELGSLLGFNLRYGFPFLGALGVMAAVVATTIATPRRLVLLTVWFSGLLSIMSTSVIQAIRVHRFSNQDQGSINNILREPFSTPPQEAINLIAQSLGYTWLPLILFSGLYVAATFALCLLIRRQKSIQWLNNVRSLVIFRNKTIAALLAMILVVFTIAAQELRTQNRAIAYRGIDQFLSENIEQGKAIAYLNSPSNYLLYGDRLSVPVLHRIPQGESDNEWLDQIQRDEANFLAFGPLYGEDSGREEIIQSLLEQGRLTPVFGEDPDNEIVIFKIH